ncbi:MAG: hypothetical protein EHM35_10820 [Planctomycetaceae bacterium]|nr:MAG: hypothetical protein EHM35_10820 [Planctomycetaceae bacterium]
MSTKIRRIPLEQLVPHPNNPNWMSRANFARLVRNIERTDRHEPLVVRPHPSKDGHFQIINGHHRRDALKELGRKTADAVVWNVDDEQTSVLLATLNRLGGRDVLDKKLGLLRRLRRHIPIPDLAKLLPQTRGQLERLLGRKPLPRTTPHSPNPFSVPMVFFVSETQQSAIEQALLLAADPVSPSESSAAPTVNSGNGNTRAARRAEALTCLAHLFIDLTRQESDE